MIKGDKMNKKILSLMSMLSLCSASNAMKKEDKKISITRELSGIANDPHRNVMPTSPRTLDAWIAQQSPRSQQNAKRRPEADTLFCCIVYYCLCMPVCHLCCQPQQYDNV